MNSRTTALILGRKALGALLFWQKQPPDFSQKMKPVAKSRTPRRRVEEILLNGPATIRDISQLAGMSEKDVSSHLPHVDKSLAARGQKLTISPYSCVSCGFVFESKKRFKKPGRCPKCKCERMEEAVFQIEG